MKKPDTYAPQKRYNQKLKETGFAQVKVLLDPATVEWLDKARGKQSRTAFVKALILKEQSK